MSLPKETHFTPFQLFFSSPSLVLSEVGQRPVSDVSRPVGDLSISGGVYRVPVSATTCQYRPLPEHHSRFSTSIFFFSFFSLRYNVPYLPTQFLKNWSMVEFVGFKYHQAPTSNQNFRQNEVYLQSNTLSSYLISPLVCGWLQSISPPASDTDSVYCHTQHIFFLLSTLSREGFV